jgi:hypothetical protein
MYTLRTAKFTTKSSGKPDGSFIRSDGWFTDNKVAAVLFDTPEEAVSHYHNVLAPLWKHDQGINKYQSGVSAADLFVVEVEVKYVIKSAKKVIVARM